MVTISACVIAKNEEENIARCLQSVKGVADEMIVVDTGSADNTAEIAEKTGAKVFHYQWNDDFSAARNYALAQAGGDWIIFLDADEYIMTEKIINLRPFIEKIHGNRNFDAICCLMENTEGWNGPLLQRNKTVRLFRNSHAIRYKGRVHEFIHKNNKFVKAVYAPEAVIVIRHTGYSDAKSVEKVRRNLPLLEKELDEGATAGHTYYYLSQSYFILQQYGKAVYFARKSLEEEVTATSQMAHKPYVFLIQGMLRLDSCDKEAVQSDLAEAVRKYPDHPEILYCLGNYQKKTGHYTKALETLLQSIQANDGYKEILLDNEFYKYVGEVHEDIAAIYDNMNNPVKALDHSVLALKSQKYFAPALDRLISLIRTQKAADIVCLLNSLYNVRDEADVDFLVRRLALLNVKQVFAYYLSKHAKQEDYAAIKLLLWNNFEHAFRIFAAVFRKSGDYGAELMAVIAAFLSDKPEWIDLLYQQKKSSFPKIAAAYFCPEEDSGLLEEDFSRYSDIVLNFVHYSDEKRMSRLLQIVFKFPFGNAPVKIAAMLLKQHLYRSALELYTCRLNRLGSGAGSAGTLYLQAGFCCYKLKDYRSAVNWFSRALKAGYSGRDIFELMEWSYQQCKEDAVKNKLQLLKASHT